MVSIPYIARRHEEIYLRFLNGRLIYTDPNSGNKITLPIRELRNPLQGKFDLSDCGDTGQYLSISTGYKKGKKPENAGKGEIWICPRFLIEKELETTATHFKRIMGNWKKKMPVGIFWTWMNDSLAVYDYLTTQSLDDLSNGDDLNDKWSYAPTAGHKIRHFFNSSHDPYAPIGRDVDLLTEPSTSPRRHVCERHFTLRF